MKKNMVIWLILIVILVGGLTIIGLKIKNENKELATAKFNEANKKIDKAVKAGVIKKNTAARNKSKLMKAINNIK